MLILVYKYTKSTKVHLPHGTPSDCSPSPVKSVAEVKVQVRQVFSCSPRHVVNALASTVTRAHCIVSIGRGTESSDSLVDQKPAGPRPITPPALSNPALSNPCSPAPRELYTAGPRGDEQEGGRGTKKPRTTEEGTRSSKGGNRSLWTKWGLLEGRWARRGLRAQLSNDRRRRNTKL